MVKGNKKFKKVVVYDNSMSLVGCIFATIFFAIFFLFTSSFISDYALGLFQGSSITILIIIWFAFAISYISSREVYWEEIK